MPDDERIVKLSSIIEVQNETITLLENVLADKTKITKFSELVTTENQKDAEIASLMLQIQQLKKGIDIRNIETNVVSKSIESLSETDTDIYLSDNSTSFLIPEDWGIKKECSLKYGKT